MEIITAWEKIYYHLKEISHKTGSLGNCYFSADSFRKYVLEGKMYQLPIVEGICFFIDKGRKWEIYLCGGEDSEWEIPHLDKPVIANFVLQHNSNIVSAEETILLSKGMRLGRTLYDFMIGSPEAEKENSFREELDRLQKSGFRFGLLDAGLFQEAYQILCRCMNPYDIVGYEEMNFPQMLTEQDVFGAINSQGRLCAVCILASSFTGGLTAVVPELRGLGLGKAITYYSYHVAKDASKQHLWIAEDNIRNQQLMRQMGAVNTGRTLRQYVLNGSEEETDR